MSDVKNMGKIEIPSEKIIFGVSKEKGISVIDTQMRMCTMDENTPIICDLCSLPLGKMKDAKNIVSPESITKAVINGYKPEKILKQYEDILKSQGEKESSYHERVSLIMKEVFAIWIDVVHNGETPWVLCDTCFEEIQKSQ